MKVAVMQPYFIPYIGYWQLMNLVDKYVIYDDVNYIKGGWINRNQILVNGEARYFNLPILGGSPNRLIHEIKIDHRELIIKKSLRTVEFAYKKAPYFADVYPLMEKIMCFDKDGIVEFIKNSFYIICDYLDISTNFLLSSSIQKNKNLKAEEKLLSICEAVGATEYYNAYGGMKLYSFEAFGKKDIRLCFLKSGDIRYRQYDNVFRENLSIIDVMMFNSKEQIKKMLNDYIIITDPNH